MKMIVLQLCLFCGLFFLLVKLGVGNNGLNELFFYPPEYQKLAFARGLADEQETQKRRKRFMLPFVAILFIALLLIVGLWNRPDHFASAYLQCLLFLLVMNWFDGIVIDELWVGHSPIWQIPGMEGIPYRQTLPQMLKKRLITSAIFIVLAAIPAGLALLIARIA